MTRDRSYKPGPIPLVSATVILQLVAAWILGTVARTSPHPGWILGAIAVLAAIGLNLFRFVIWGYTHRRYPLSHTYPLTALFFPCILVLSYFQGDVIGVREIGGTLLITLGAFALAASKENKGGSHG